MVLVIQVTYGRIINSLHAITPRTIYHWAQAIPVSIINGVAIGEAVALSFEMKYSPYFKFKYTHY